MSRILCVEDDEETASLIAEALRDCGYAVERAADGDAGLTRILDWQPDLVLCDVRMPRMSGFELLQKVSAAGPAFAAIPFVFLTALGDREHELSGRRLGAEDYLTKPVDFELLAVVIENRLRGRHGSTPSGLTLTQREKEVLTWVGRGKTSAEIAVILGLTERTVNFHCNGAMKRLDVTNRTQAAVKAMAEGLISV